MTRPQDTARIVSGSASSGSGCALELRDVRKSFGKTEIIRGTSLAVRPGERVAVILSLIHI